MLKIKSENKDDMTIHYDKDGEDIEYQIYIEEDNNIKKGDNNE